MGAVAVPSFCNMCCFGTGTARRVCHSARHSLTGHAQLHKARDEKRPRIQIFAVKHLESLPNRWRTSSHKCRPVGMCTAVRMSMQSAPLLLIFTHFLFGHGAVVGGGPSGGTHVIQVPQHLHRHWPAATYDRMYRHLPAAAYDRVYRHLPATQVSATQRSSPRAIMPNTCRQQQDIRQFQPRPQLCNM